MTTRREQILLALHAALQTAPGLTVLRNVPLGEFGGDTFCGLSDGDSAPGDVYLNPPVYEFTMSPSVLVIVKGDDDAARDAAVDAALVVLLASLGGMQWPDGMTDMRPQPPTYSPEAVWGAANSKAAEFTLEIDYWADTSAG